MELPDDLKNYKAPLGAFQLITPDAAAFIVCMAVALAAIFHPYL